MLPDIIPTGYTISHLIGSGQTSHVYYANHYSLGHIALKMMRPEAKGKYPLVSMFTNEVQLTRRLQHPNIIKAFDGKPTEPGAYLALEYCAGGTLDEYLTASDGKLELKISFRLIKQISSGLAFSHSRGILHRDVKPANVLLTSGHEAKLADFGTGIYIQEASAKERVGTAFYMAPELFQGEKPTVQSDIYSLGILSYELITGVRPFVGRSQEEIMLAHLRQIPISPSNYRKDLDQKVINVIMKSLSRSPKKRHQTVDEFKEDFNKATGIDLKSVQVDATPTPVVGRAGRYTKTESSQNQEAESKKRKKKSNGLLSRLLGKK